MRDLVLERDLVDAVLERVERERVAGGAAAAELDGVEDALGREREELLLEDAIRARTSRATLARAAREPAVLQRFAHDAVLVGAEELQRFGRRRRMAGDQRAHADVLAARQLDEARGGRPGGSPASARPRSSSSACSARWASTSRAIQAAKRTRVAVQAAASSAALALLGGGERRSADRPHRCRVASGDSGADSGTAGAPLPAASARAMMNAVERCVFAAASAISPAIA